MGVGLRRPCGLWKERSSLIKGFRRIHVYIQKQPGVIFRRKDEIARFALESSGPGYLQGRNGFPAELLQKISIVENLATKAAGVVAFDGQSTIRHQTKLISEKFLGAMLDLMHMIYYGTVLLRPADQAPNRRRSWTGN